jgi:hypothetical protein
MPKSTLFFETLLVPMNKNANRSHRFNHIKNFANDLTGKNNAWTLQF